MKFIFLKKSIARPSGGHRFIRHLVSCINRLGYEAYLHYIDQNYDRDWTFDLDVPIIKLNLTQMADLIENDDIVIIPENNITEYFSIVEKWCCRKGVLNQNGYYAVKSCSFMGYKKYAIDFVIATSPYIASIVRNYFMMPRSRITIIPYFISETFLDQNDGYRRVKDSICFMPRKLPKHVELIRTIVSKKRPEVTWVPIDNISDSAVAVTLRSSSIFLSTQNMEGFGLPALEAMSCGCIVAGYAGTGRFPHPYASRNNGFWAPDRSVASAAYQLCMALNTLEEGGLRLANIVKDGLRTAESYSYNNFECTVKNFILGVSKNTAELDITKINDLRLIDWLEIAKIVCS